MIRYYVNGVQHRESTGTSNRRKAEKILQDTLAKISSGKFLLPEQRKVMVSELVDDLLMWYRTVDNKPVFADDTETRWNLHLKEHFGRLRADQVNTDSMRWYRKARMSEDKPPAVATVNRELQILRKAFHLAHQASPPKIQSVPAFEMAREDNTRMTFITEEDKQKLRDAAACDTSTKAKMKGVFLKCFIELLFGFGWRKGELTNLQVGNVNLAEGFIRIDDSKSGEPREVPFTPSLRVLLEAVCTGRAFDEPLFPAKDMRHAWRRLCKAAGVKTGKAGGYVIHDARRTSARTKRAAGEDETVICAIMGWKPGSKMFPRYGIVNRADMQEALRRSEQWEQDQANQKHFEHSSSIDSTDSGASGASTSNKNVN